MLLTNPIWLWALAGLSIPIGIHLLSRKEGKVIKIGSLRHLQETNTRQFKGIRLNEIVLLSLRCLLIILFVLLLTGLNFNVGTKSESKWVLVERGLENSSEVKTQLENFQKDGYELRWLSEGFPLLEDSASIPSSDFYWKLIEDLQSKDFSEAIVIAKNRVEGFKGKRPVLPSNIRWISVPSEQTEFTLRAISTADSVVVRKGYTNSEITYFDTEVHSANGNQSTDLSPSDTIDVVIAADNSHQYDRKIIESALLAVKQSFPIKMEIVISSPKKIDSKKGSDWLIWLTDQPIPKTSYSQMIYLKSGLSSGILYREKKSQWIITKLLNEEIALNDHLTLQLASILLPSQKMERIALQHDRRVLPEEIAWSKASKTERGNTSVASQSAESYLIALLLIILFAERILAYHRNQ